MKAALLPATILDALARKVNAILAEAGVHPATGRERPDIGRVPQAAPITRLIDHTLLKPEATARQIEQLCHQARQYDFATVCINTVFVPLAAELLRGSSIGVCTTIGFPLGATLPQVKTYEAHQAIAAGAQELDMVIHIGALKRQDYVSVFEDITEVAAVCHESGCILKVIIETALLTDEEKIVACLLAKQAGADFVKTSTGFSGGGADVDDIQVMRRIVGPGMGVKASGGIRDLQTARAMVEAGANRLGASAGVTIAAQLERETATSLSSTANLFDSSEGDGY